MSVADTIWKQISNNTKMSVAARNPLSSDDSLQFQVTINPRKTHKITVTYTVGDTYTVACHYIRGVDCRLEKQIDDIYCDQLDNLIFNWCNNPELYLSSFRRKNLS